MQRIFLATLLVLAIVPGLTTRCLPLAAWSGDGYTVDATHGDQGSAIAGHCFRLTLDARLLSCPRHIPLRGGGTVEVEGCIRVITPGTSAARVELPKGSQIVVDKVLVWRNIETSNVTPYVRIHGALFDASDLFEGTHRLTYNERFLAPCP